MNKALIVSVAFLALLSFLLSLWLDVSRGFSATRDVLLAVCYIAVLALLIRKKVVIIPAQLFIPHVSRGLRVFDFIRSVGLFLFASVWAYVFARFANDSWWTVGAVVVPPIVFLLIGAAYFYKSIGPRNGR